MFRLGFLNRKVPINLQVTILNRIKPEGFHILQVVLADLPGPMGSLPRQLVVCPADITGIQAAHYGVFGAAVSCVPGHADLLPLPVHMVEQTAQVFSRDIGFESPGDVGVAKNHAGVGHALHHHVLVDHFVP